MSHRNIMFDRHALGMDLSSMTPLIAYIDTVRDVDYYSNICISCRWGPSTELGYLPDQGCECPDPFPDWDVIRVVLIPENPVTSHPTDATYVIQTYIIRSHQGEDSYDLLTELADRAGIEGNQMIQISVSRDIDPEINYELRKVYDIIRGSEDLIYDPERFVSQPPIPWNRIKIPLTTTPHQRYVTFTGSFEKSSASAYINTFEDILVAQSKWTPELSDQKPCPHVGRRKKKTQPKT